MESERVALGSAEAPQAVDAVREGGDAEQVTINAAVLEAGLFSVPQGE